MLRSGSTAYDVVGMAVVVAVVEEEAVEEEAVEGEGIAAKIVAALRNGTMLVGCWHPLVCVLTSLEQRSLLHQAGPALQ